MRRDGLLGLSDMLLLNPQTNSGPNNEVERSHGKLFQTHTGSMRTK